MFPGGEAVRNVSFTEVHVVLPAPDFFGPTLQGRQLGKDEHEHC